MGECEERRCGTCAWWKREEFARSWGYCEWPRSGDIPSSFERGTVGRKEGTTCPCWKPAAKDAADAR